MLSQQYRRKVEQARTKIASLSKDKGRLATRRATLTQWMNVANERAMQTSNSSTIRAKLREAERTAKDLAKVEGDIDRLDNKIAQEYKKLSDAEKTLAREQATAQIHQLQRNALEMAFLSADEKTTLLQEKANQNETL